MEKFKTIGIVKLRNFAPGFDLLSSPPPPPGRGGEDNKN